MFLSVGTIRFLKAKISSIVSSISIKLAPLISASFRTTRLLFFAATLPSTTDFASSLERNTQPSSVTSSTTSNGIPDARNMLKGLSSPTSLLSHPQKCLNGPLGFSPAISSCICELFFIAGASVSQYSTGNGCNPLMNIVLRTSESNDTESFAAIFFAESASCG